MKRPLSALTVLVGTASVGVMPASAQSANWTIDACYTKAQLGVEAARPGVEYKAGLEPVISPGVQLDAKDTDTESPFYDKTLQWKMERFALMIAPGGFAALTTEHAKQSGESLDEAQRAVTNERAVLWMDLRTAGIRLKVGAIFRDQASGRTAKLLSDALPDTGEPTKFCVVAVQ
jgi:hypothetical protein